MDAPASPAAAVANDPAPQALGRMLNVFHLLSQRPEGETLTGISRRLGLPKSTLSNILRHLTRQSYLVQGDNRRYRLGPAAFHLAMAMLSTRELTAIARPFMTRLAEESGETVLIGGLATDAPVAMYTDVVESSSPVRYTVRIGDRRDLYCSAIGKLVLAHMEPERRESYYRQVRLKAYTPRTIRSMKALREEIEATGHRGYSVTVDEGVLGASAVGAPVYDHDGRFISGVALAGPTQRIQQDRERFVALVRRTAAALSSTLGHAGPG